MDKRFRYEYEMSNFLFSIIEKVPIGSTWYVVEYLEDIWADFPEFHEANNFLTKNRSLDKNSSVIKIRIDKDFIYWFKSFLKKNYKFWGYLDRHCISFDDKVYFVQIESTNIHLNKHLELRESQLKEIESIGNFISIEEDISTNEIFFLPIDTDIKSI